MEHLVYQVMKLLDLNQIQYSVLKTHEKKNQTKQQQNHKLVQHQDMFIVLLRLTGKLVIISDMVS